MDNFLPVAGRDDDGGDLAQQILHRSDVRQKVIARKEISPIAQRDSNIYGELSALYPSKGNQMGSAAIVLSDVVGEASRISSSGALEFEFHFASVHAKETERLDDNLLGSGFDFDSLAGI